MEPRTYVQKKSYVKKDGTISNYEYTNTYVPTGGKQGRRAKVLSDEQKMQIIDLYFNYALSVTKIFQATGISFHYIKKTIAEYNIVNAM